MTKAFATACVGLVLCAPLPGQPAEVRFEAADVHPSASAMNAQTFRSGGFLRGTRYDLRKATMLDLIRLAYGFDPDSVLGGPQWLEFDRFDIAAKAPATSSAEDIRFMLQSLLRERFALTFHEEDRPMPAFVLMQGAKPKMKRSVDAGNPECKWVQQPAPYLLNVYSCRNMTMTLFARQLRGMAGDYLADPVVDSTGLAGEWDFDLQWNGRSRVLPAGAERKTIFQAIEQQLGLDLRAGKLPAKVVVIDSVREKPTANVPNVEALLPPRELQFEVASVRPSRPEQQDGYSGVTPLGEFEAHGETMRNLFATAWDIHWDHVDELIVGMPKWMDSARYDIQARPAAAMTGSAPPRSSFVDDDLRTMLRALLTERFKIKTHVENRIVNAYTLVAAGPRMKKADPANRANCKEAHTVENDPRDLNPRMSRLLACQNVTTSQFAAQLLVMSPNDFAYPVEDATRIKGSWDLLLNYTPTGDRRVPSNAEPELNGAISIFEAMPKQLGVKLEKRKRRLPVLVIDHIEEKPIEN